MNELVSIIIPVYNVEKYVQACLESIAAQTYTNLEVIIVDDGSTDSSGKICEAFCGQDNRFQYIRQTNQGAGIARNTGIRHSTGQYVWFVDSDDTLLPDAVETAYEAIVSGPYELVVEGFARTDDSGKMIDIPGQSEKQIDLSGEDAVRRMLFGTQYERFCFTFACCKLYKRTLLSDLEFGVFFSGEDANFIFRVYQRANSIAFINKVTTLWRQRPGSITHDINRHRLGSFHAFVSLNSMTDFAPDDTFRSLFLRKAYRFMNTTRAHLVGTESYVAFLNEARSFRAQTLKEFYKNKGISLMEKFIVSACWTFPRIFGVVFNRLGN